MFQKQTLLILGAGASKPYGFPLGYELIENIINSIKYDTIFFPFMNENKNKIMNGDELSLEDYEVFRDIEKKDNILNTIRKKIVTGNLGQIIENKSLNLDISNSNIDNCIYQLIYPHNLIRVELYRIKELHQLSQMLEDFDPVSIDSFLKEHPEHKLAGQIMIIYCLIKCHDKKRFKKIISDTDITQKKEEICILKKTSDSHDNWYRYLLSDIKAGCKQSSDIMDNNLSIITFNYDVSLDYYLNHYLIQTPFFSDHASTYLKENLVIHHIYGSICNIDDGLDNFYNLVQSESSPIEVDAMNFHHLLYAYMESSKEEPRIKLIGDRLCGDAIEKINAADIIMFIGFSFDSDNLRVLGFPEDIHKYSELFPPKQFGSISTPKKIFYLDYMGKMNSLGNEFKELETTLNGGDKYTPYWKIRRSTASLISDAYFNDFRSSFF